jgi:hypothetical protein
MRIRAVVAGLALAGTLTGAAPALAEGGKAPAGRQCFFRGNVSGFAPQDDRTVNVRVGARDIYRLELFGPCPDVNWRERIGIVSRGSDWICSGLDAEIVTPSRIGPQRCPVGHIRKLTPAEVAALPRRARP